VSCPNLALLAPASHTAGVNDSFGAQIRRARERQRLSQEELAAKLGVSLRTIGNWERGASVPRARREDLERVLQGLPPLQDGSAEPASEETPRTYTQLVGGGLVIKIELAPGAKLEDVIAKQSQIAEIVARRLAELDAEDADQG
jgi:transcriptional regulator with XRE-family HTH domain